MTQAPTLEQLLRGALDRIRTLEADIDRTRVENLQQREELDRLRETVQTVDGRSQRHEAGHDAVRAVLAELATLQERVEQEVALRRDLLSLIRREAEREHGEQDSVSGTLSELLERVGTFEDRLAADDVQRRRLLLGIADTGIEEHVLLERLTLVEQRAAADRHALQQLSGEISRVAAAVPDLASSVRDIDTRSRETQIGQRRTGDEVSALASERGRETELLELVDQQRALRMRLEERLSAVEEDVAAIRLELAASAEERALLRHQTTAAHERIREAREAMEAQKAAIVEYLRMMTQADVVADRRLVEENERSNKIARDLLLRLEERSDEAGQEQPL